MRITSGPQGIFKLHVLNNHKCDITTVLILTQALFSFNQEDEGGLFLIETNINGTTKELAAKIKGDDKEMVKEFVEIYKNIITRKWIQ